MKKVIITPSVEISMSSLKPDAVRQLQAWFDDLKRWDEDEALRQNSVLLETIPGVYYMRTATDIRIFFRIDGDTITVLDVAKISAILASGGVHVSGSANGTINPEHKVK